MTNPETPLEIARRWQETVAKAALRGMVPPSMQQHDSDALARAVIEADAQPSNGVHFRNGQTHERARIVAAIRNLSAKLDDAGATTRAGMNRILADWIERGCPDD